MDSPYKRNNFLRKTTEPKSTKVQPKNEESKSAKNNKNDKKSDLKGGSFLENDHQDEKSNFVSKARKLVDNV